MRVGDHRACPYRRVCSGMGRSWSGRRLGLPIGRRSNRRASWQPDDFEELKKTAWVKPCHPRGAFRARGLSNWQNNRLAILRALAHTVHRFGLFTTMHELTPLPEPSPGVDQRCARWFAEEVQPHDSALKSWLRSRFPWLMEVDDIAQEAAVRLWRRRNNPVAAPIKSGKAALFAIARNAAIDEARHRAVVSMRSVTELEGLSVLDDGADVVATVDARQELEFFAEALRDLPARCRQVVTLTKVYGLSEREVAAQLGISPNTVRTQVVRGMERCTNYLRERGVKRNRRHAR